MHKCRKCGFEGELKYFGERVTGAARYVAQSWCKKCRSVRAKPTIESFNQESAVSVLRTRYAEAFPNDKNRYKRARNFMLAKLEKRNKKNA